MRMLGLVAGAMALIALLPSRADAKPVTALARLTLADDGFDDDSPPPKKKHHGDDDDDDSAPPKKKHASDDDDDSAQPKKKKSADSDDDVAPKKKRAVDDEDDSASTKKSADDESSEKPETVHGGWGAIAGNPPNGQVVLGEIGIPGIRGLYLTSNGDRLAYGGGGEVDFPPVDGASNSTRGFNAIRFVGVLNYTLPTDLFALFVHFEPQWIFVFGNGSQGGIFYFPLALGAGFDLKVIHLEADLGVALFFSGTSFILPFDNVVLSSPFIGVGAEYPLSDQLAITLRFRMQTFAWDSAPAGTELDRAPTLFGFGYVLAGAAYRF